MAISKKVRLELYQKYNGLCGYTGKPLDANWQVDHIKPKKHYRRYRSAMKKKCDNRENLLPAIRIINHYKRAQDLEQFRQYISTLHIRLKKLPKNTKVPHTESRKRYLQEVASHFDVTPDSPFGGVFYFETTLLTHLPPHLPAHPIAQNTTRFTHHQ